MKGKKFYKALQTIATLFFVYYVYQMVVWITLTIMGYIDPTSVHFTAGFIGLKIIPEEVINVPLWYNLLFFSHVVLQAFLTWQIRTFLKNLVQEQIFVQQNVRCMRNTGITFLFFFIVDNLIAKFSAETIFKFFNPEPNGVINELIERNTMDFPPQKTYWLAELAQGKLLYRFDLDTTSLMTGIAILILCLIFKNAVRIKDENDLMI